MRGRQTDHQTWGAGLVKRASERAIGSRGTSKPAPRSPGPTSGTSGQPRLSSCVKIHTRIVEPLLYGERLVGWEEPTASGTCMARSLFILVVVCSRIVSMGYGCAHCRSRP